MCSTSTFPTYCIGSSTPIRHISLRSLLPNTDAFMTYEGSTTHPGCWESTVWIILNKPIYITKQELYALRRLMQGSEQTPKAPLGNNARPLQPLHHRTVRTNIDFQSAKVRIRKGPILKVLSSYGSYGVIKYWPSSLFSSTSFFCILTRRIKITVQPCTKTCTIGPTNGRPTPICYAAAATAVFPISIQCSIRCTRNNLEPSPPTIAPPLPPHSSKGQLPPQSRPPPKPPALSHNRPPHRRPASKSATKHFSGITRHATMLLRRMYVYILRLRLLGLKDTLLKHTHSYTETNTCIYTIIHKLYIYT